MQDREVAGLRCRDVLARLSDYLDGDLADDARAQLEAHVRGCPDCARFGARFGQLVGTLRGGGPDDADDVPAAVAGALDARLRRITDP
ncbi:MAG: zf-HC2 domain-containing protein [Kofleriaceae bacterium]|nr:zf-HC2 domain-containing protein [Kofleriaceae bacterium]MCB9572701.1 zf-HC2 domain-containing protein [Kofleriaceae bacterium]